MRTVGPPRDPWELRLQRVALAATVYVGFHAQPRFSEQPFPLGVSTLIDFSCLARPAAAAWVEWALLASIVLYIAGRAMVLATGVMLAAWVAAGALASSQGALGHKTQLLAMVLIGQLFAYVQASRARGANGAHGLAVYYSQEVIAAGYILAGLTKIVLSRGRWIEQIPLVVTEIAKTHGQTYYSTLQQGVIERGDAIATVILAHPNLTRVLFGCGGLLEISAGVALLGRRSAFAVGIGLLAMHWAIAELMLIEFPENEALLAIYFVNVPFLLVIGVRRLTGFGGQRRSGA